MEKNANSAEIKKYLNFFFNPLEHKDIPRSPTDSSFTTGLKHAGGLAIGYGTLGLLIRKAKQMKEQADKKADKEKMEAYIAGKNPILSIDKSKRDKKREEKYRQLGVSDVETESDLLKTAALAEQIYKEASTAPSFSESSNALASGVRGLSKGITSLSDRDVHPTHLAAAVVAALAGTYGGYRLGDRIQDQRTKARLKKEIAERENDIDKLLLEEYNRVREKQASVEYATWRDARDNPMPELNREEVHQILEKLASQQASFRDAGRSSSSPEAAIAAEPGRLIDAAGSLYALYSIITLALGYKAARAYWDKTDPNRQRVDHLKSIIDEKGKVKGAPTFTDMSKIEQTTSPSRKKRHSVQIQEKKDNRNPASKTVVDDSDPYSQLLAGS